VSVILHDQRSVMTVCLPLQEVAGVPNVTLSLPRLLGGKGVLETLPLPLTDDENSRLRQSAQVIRQALDELGDEELSAGAGSPRSDPARHGYNHLRKTYRN
jgi:L-lactate dehydrogenase